MYISTSIFDCFHLCYCAIVIGFFFFKQKTAYEMRISDWSSDVCSSDLYPVHNRHPGPPSEASASDGNRRRVGGRAVPGLAGKNVRRLCAGGPGIRDWLLARAGGIDSIRRSENGGGAAGAGLVCVHGEKHQVPDSLAISSPRSRETPKIGRTACRARGCQNG